MNRTERRRELNGHSNQPIDLSRAPILGQPMAVLGRGQYLTAADLLAEIRLIVRDELRALNEVRT